MSRLNPKVAERFKAKSKKYDEVAIRSVGNRYYEIVGIKRKGKGEYIEPVTDRPCSLRKARISIWDYAEIQDGLPVIID